MLNMAMAIINAMPNQQLSPRNIIDGYSHVHPLVTWFYDSMDEDPDFYNIRKLHPELLHGSREKLLMFSSGWLGGPSVFIDAFGHPRLRARTCRLRLAQASATNDELHDCRNEGRGY